MAYITRTSAWAPGLGTAEPQTITATGTAQLVAAANVGRGAIFLVNRGTHAMDLGFSSTITAGNGIPLPIGTPVVFNSGVIPSNAMYVVGTAGDNIVVWQG